MDKGIMDNDHGQNGFKRACIVQLSMIVHDHFLTLHAMSFRTGHI